MLDLSRLNGPQREAALHGDTPLLVLAGAGTGKTTVITYRVAHFLHGRQVPTHAVLALTFTNKAAREMRERAARLAGVPEQDLTMGTFHSFCGRLLRRYGDRLGLPRDFVIYDQDDQLQLVRHCLKGLGIDPKQYPPDSIRHRIEQWKNKGLLPKQVTPDTKSPVERLAHEVYGIYRRRCLDLQVVDFGDLLLHVLCLLRDHDDVRQRLQERYSHVLVDEYQDTNPVQYKLLKELVSERHSLTVVGDDDQSIYRWRGADIGNILRFERDFPGAHIVRLEENYRSTPNILDVANAVIARNVARKGKTLFSQRDRGSKVRFVLFFTEREEADAIAQEIQRRANRGAALEEVAILYRTNAQSRALEEALRRLRIPYAVYGGMRFYDRKEIKDALAYLRLLVNPSSDVDFLRVVNTPPRGIGQTSLTRIAELARERGCSLFDAARLAVEGAGKFSGKARLSLKRFLHMVEQYAAQRAGASLGAMLEAYLATAGYVTLLKEARRDEAADRLENISALAGALNEYCELSDNPSLEGFLEEVALTSDADAVSQQEGVVSLMTMHSAKGLEFGTVFLPGMEEGLFPHSRSLDDRSALEEERRLCYVGLTRAKDDLWLSAVRVRHLYGEAKPTELSRFLGEIPPELIDASAQGGDDRRAGQRRSAHLATPRYDRNLTAAREPVAIRRAAPAKVQTATRADAGPYAPGARVRHATFGEGEVLAAEGEGARRKLTIDFPQVGRKVIVARFVDLA